MSEIKQPQDRKSKSARTFTFEDVDGESHTLPLASAGRERLTGRDVRDAALGGEMGQLAYLFKVLEAADPDEDALNAMYDLPQDEMVDILQRWGKFGDGDGGDLGK